MQYRMLFLRYCRHTLYRYLITVQLKITIICTTADVVVKLLLLFFKLFYYSVEGKRSSRLFIGLKIEDRFSVGVAVADVETPGNDLRRGGGGNREVVI